MEKQTQITHHDIWSNAIFTEAVNVVITSKNANDLATANFTEFTEQFPNHGKEIVAVKNGSKAHSMDGFIKCNTILFGEQFKHTLKASAKGSLLVSSDEFGR